MSDLLGDVCQLSVAKLTLDCVYRTEKRIQDLPLSLLQSLRSANPFAGANTAAQLSCFPARFCQGGGLASSQVCQDLLTVGTRLWGIGAAQNLLRVKIYEFAVYMDGPQVTYCRSCHTLAGLSQQT